MKIHSGDKVRIMKGRDRGKIGTVIGVNIAKNQVKIEGVNTHKRHLRRAKKAGAAGGVTEINLPVSAANVMLIDPSTDRPTKVGYKIVSGKKVRISKKSQTVIENVKK